MNELDKVQNEMLCYLNSIDFSYYKEVFDYSRWETINKTLLQSYYGCNSKGKGYDFTPMGVTLNANNQTRFIRINDLKKLFERSGEQLSLF